VATKLWKKKRPPTTREQLRLDLQAAKKAQRDQRREQQKAAKTKRRELEGAYLAAPDAATRQGIVDQLLALLAAPLKVFTGGGGPAPLPDVTPADVASSPLSAGVVTSPAAGQTMGFASELAAKRSILSAAAGY
jgi:hypothetical protein